jgi:hypothetical protein
MALTACLASVFTLIGFFPLSPFIGGPAFLSLEIVMVPVIAALLRPALATGAVSAGSLGMAFSQTSLFQVFGLLGLTVPIVGALFGSLAFHHKAGPFIPWGYVTVGALYYLIFSEGGTLLWLLPYSIVALSLPFVLKSAGPIRVVYLTLYTTMAELVTMNVLSIAVLRLVGAVWLVITPLMFSERALATFGGATIILALRSRLGSLRAQNSSKTIG